MADTPEQLRRIVARLRTRGFEVHEVPGWETRGTTPMTTRGRVEHHTATPRSARGDAPTLRVVTYGHGTLRNSLSRWYVSRSGVIYLVALRTSWHAGAGVKGTNPTLSGTEAEHSGTAGEPWSPPSLDAQAAISQEEAAEFGFATSQVWEHKEHAPARKVDRAHINGADWRRRLGQRTTPPRPAPTVPSEEDDVLVRIKAKGHNIDVVYHVVGGMLHPLTRAQAEVLGGDGWRGKVRQLDASQAAAFAIADPDAGGVLARLSQLVTPFGRGKVLAAQAIPFILVNVKDALEDLGYEIPTDERPGATKVG